VAFASRVSSEGPAPERRSTVSRVPGERTLGEVMLPAWGGLAEQTTRGSGLGRRSDRYVSYFTNKNLGSNVWGPGPTIVVAKLASPTITGVRVNKAFSVGDTDNSGAPDTG
jgi:hypothetical protein